MKIVLSLLCISCFTVGMEEEPISRLEKETINFFKKTCRSGSLLSVPVYCKEQLSYAVKKDYMEYLRVAYEAADENSGFSPINDEMVKCAFLLAVEKNNFNAVQFFMEKGMDINAGHSKTKVTALIIAAYKNHYTLVSYLLEKGAKTEQVSTDKKTALAYAVLNNSPIIVSLLLEGKQCAKKKNNGTPCGDINKANPNGPSPEKQYKTIFNWLCAQKNHIFFLDDFIKAGAILNPQNIEHHPLLSAIKSDNAQAITILLKNGANPNFRLSTTVNPFAFASSKNTIDPLALAAINGRAAASRALLEGAQRDIYTLEFFKLLRLERNNYISILPNELIQELINFLACNAICRSSQKSNYLDTALRLVQSKISKETDSIKKDNLKQSLEVLKQYKLQDNLELGWEEMEKSDDNTGN